MKIIPLMQINKNLFSNLKSNFQELNNWSKTVLFFKALLVSHDIVNDFGLCIIELAVGGLAERFKAPSWKEGEVQASFSSNILSSANWSIMTMYSQSEKKPLSRA